MSCGQKAMWEAIQEEAFEKQKKTLFDKSPNKIVQILDDALDSLRNLQGANLRLTKREHAHLDNAIAGIHGLLHVKD
jgi:hypothetical protein